MTEEQREDILVKAKTFFKERIAENHKHNTEKCKKLSAFNVNPFLDTYLANYAYGDSSPESIAKALIYPRILGTSITTSFGAQIQNFCNVVLDSYASLIPGIDIEFLDTIDGRKKYCQTKAGPNTINKDDVPSIIGHFRDIRNLARTNQNRDINPSIDCVVGVLYGSFEDLSSFYLAINKEYPVICGQRFWHRLTSDESFYNELISAFGEVAIQMDSRELIAETIESLSKEIEEKGRQ